MMNKKQEAIVQIILLIGMSFAFSYFINESDKNESNRMDVRKSGKGKILEVYSKILKIVFSERGFVSASSVATCIETKDGKYCQEYDDSECNEKCKEKCIPATREKTSECKIGTCVDFDEGSCSIAPKLLCEKNNGKWHDNPNANIPECAKFCCSIGNTNVFVTERRCEVLASRLGVEKKIKKEIKSELGCWLLGKMREEGACILGKEADGKNICKFLTREECDSKRGEFYPGYLCSNPELNTNCEKQKTAKCVEGKDELYWIDSCGNRENIYDANKARSWNNGKVLKKEESCLIGTMNNPFANRGSCGNCDYILGSICGEKTENQKVSDETINYVCRDLSCVDEWGNKRAHGESWCHYQSLTGVDAKTNTSMDSPGSRHFVMSCVNGEVRIQPCADYRTEVCREARVDIDGKKYSQASCSVNLAFECIKYNRERGKTENEKKKFLEKCEENPDCFVKETKISDFFKFEVCAPKYPLGFNLETNPSVAQLSCGLATQKCKVMEVKEIDGWECKANCDCLTEEFARKMNQLCISLGDCGGEANYLGDYSKNFRIDIKGKSYTSEMKGLVGYNPENSEIANYHKENPNNFINVQEFFNKFARRALLKSGIYTDSKSYLDQISMYSGVAGMALSIIGKGAGVLGSATVPAAAQMAGSVQAAATQGALSSATAGTAAAVSAALNVLSIGLIAAGITMFLLQATGVEAGLPPEVTYSLVGAAFIGGLMFGAYATGFIGVGGAGAATTLFGGATTATIATTAAAAAAIGWIGFGIVIAVIAFILIAKFVLHVGEKNEITITFNCYPWEPPVGGENCEKCGSDGLPCTKYSCESLGKGCRYFDESETGITGCKWVDKNDIVPPEIKPLDILPKGYKYSDVSKNGFRIESDEKDGCVKAYDFFYYGIALDKIGQCKYAIRNEIGEKKVKFDEMTYFFGESNVFSMNHSMPMMSPSLGSLGVFETPEDRIELEMIVKCRNVNGYENLNDYLIRMCIAPGKDITPPVILGYEPDGGFVKSSTNENELVIYTNEPAECKFDYEEKSYEQMNRSMVCEREEAFYKGMIAYKCSDRIEIGRGNLTFYVLCKDQPWLSGINESARNLMTNARKIEVKKTEALRIDSFSPSYNEKILFAKEPATIEVVVKTSGGLDGNAKCSYAIGNDYIEFSTTFGREHKQVFNQLWKEDAFGNKTKTIKIKCEDLIGNVAEYAGSFEIEIDDSPPKITRVYQKDEALYILTDEDAECVYNLENCNFEIGKTISMGGDGKVHFIENIEKLKKYYMKCADKLGNFPGECSIEVMTG